MKGKRKIKVWENDNLVEEGELFLPNIKSIVGLLQGTWNFRMYDNCFDGKNKLSDVDGSIEVYGHTLILEFKLERSALTAGQVVKAIRQAKHSNITTIFIFGQTDRPVEYLIFSPNNIKGSGFKKCNTAILSMVFHNWNNWAKKNDLTKVGDNDWAIAKKYLDSVGGGKK